MREKVKAIGLISGGLDSELSLKLILDQGIQVTGVHFSHLFSTPAGESVKPNIQAVADELGIPVRIIEVSKKILSIVKNPAHGYGSGVNPCIDCRIFQLRQAKQLLEETESQFVVTGEVIGQRPMSQHRKTINLIERESGLQGLIVRPLSGKLLDPTIPEQRGWIDREKLLDHSGRSRKVQLALAEKYGFTAFTAPAGERALTDPSFCERITESFDHDEQSLTDIELLKVGRHFRLRDHAKAVVGRKHDENELIVALAQKGDILLKPMDVPGPTVLLRNAEGDSFDIFLQLAAGLLAKYTKKAEEVRVWYGPKEGTGITKLGQIDASEERYLAGREEEYQMI